MKKIKILLNRLRSQYPNYKKQKRIFGFKIAFWTYLVRTVPFQFVIEKHIKTLNSFLNSLLSDVIQKYNHIQPADPPASTDVPIWVCWFTGMESSPALVQACYKSVSENIPENARLELLTLDNIPKFITIPEYINELFISKKMSPAAYSDIVRVMLLEKYGGLWLDATIFVSDKIPESIFDGELFTLKSDLPDLYKDDPSKGSWCNFIWGCQPGNILMSFAKEALFLYWSKYETIVEYILPDHIVYCAYNAIPEVRRMIDAIPPNIHDIWLGMKQLDFAFTDSTMQELTQNSIFNKLTYRREFKTETSDNQQTLYAHITEPFIK